jgi:hypothetical protein
MFLQWTPVKGLVLKTNNAFETTVGDGRRYWSPEANDGESTLQMSKLQYVQMTTSNTISYSNLFADTHSFRILAGQEAMRNSYNSMYLYSPNVDPAIPYPIRLPQLRTKAAMNTMLTH